MNSIHGARAQAACWLSDENTVHQVSPERKRIERKKGSIWSLPGPRGLFLIMKRKGERQGRHHRPSCSHLLSEDVRGPVAARGGGKARWPSGGLFSASLYTTWKRDGLGSTCGRGPSLPSWTFSTRSRLQPAFQWRQVTDGPGPGHVSPEAGWGGRTAVG